MVGGHPASRRSKTNLTALSAHHRNKSHDGLHKSRRAGLSHQNLKQLSSATSSTSPTSPDEPRHAPQPFTVSYAAARNPPRKKSSGGNPNAATAHKKHKNAMFLDHNPADASDEDDRQSSPNASPSPDESNPDSSWISESEASTPAHSRPPSPYPTKIAPRSSHQDQPSQQQQQQPQKTDNSQPTDLGATPKPTNVLSSSPETFKTSSENHLQRQVSPEKRPHSPPPPSLTRMRNPSTASIRSNSSVISARLLTPALRSAPKALHPKLDRGFEAPSVSANPQQLYPTATASNSSANQSTAPESQLSSQARQQSTATLVTHPQSTSGDPTSSDLTRRLEDAMSSKAPHQQQHQNSLHASNSSTALGYASQMGKKLSAPANGALGAVDMPQQRGGAGAAQSQQFQRKRQSPLISKFISPSSQTYPAPPALKHRHSGSGIMHTLPEEASHHQEQQQQQQSYPQPQSNRPVSRTQQRLMMERNAPPVMPAPASEPHYHPGSEAPCTQAHGQLIPPHAHHPHHPPLSPATEERAQQQQQLHMSSITQQQQQQLQQQQQQQYQHLLQAEDDDQLNEPAHRARQVHSLKMWALAVVREAEKVDKEHDFVRRFHDPVADSLARCVLFIEKVHDKHPTDAARCLFAEWRRRRSNMLYSEPDLLRIKSAVTSLLVTMFPSSHSVHGVKNVWNYCISLTLRHSHVYPQHLCPPLCFLLCGLLDRLLSYWNSEWREGQRRGRLRVLIPACSLEAL